MQQTASFYLDWNFWAVFVAGVALILSQLPPLWQMFSRPRLELELFSRIALKHKVGNPNIQIHVIVENVGGQSVRVRGMSLKLRRDNQDLGEYPAQNYYQTPSDNTSVLFTPFTLDSKQMWSHGVNFLNFFPRNDERRFGMAQLALRRDIANKRALPENKDRLVEAEPALVEPLTHMFDEKFIWFAGDYQFEITVATDQPSKSWLRRRFRFTLYESDADALASVRGAYKIGDGIYWDDKDRQQVFPAISEA